MVACEEYGKGEVGGAGCQPFTVSVAHPALALMDFHAHLCDHEIIGLLAGTFDAATRSMRFAFPGLPSHSCDLTCRTSASVCSSHGSEAEQDARCGLRIMYVIYHALSLAGLCKRHELEHVARMHFHVRFDVRGRIDYST